MTLWTWCRSLAERSQASGFDPRRYWEDRHRRLTGKLAAVGHRLLREEDNAAQYSVKKEALTAILRRHVATFRGKKLLDAGCGVGVLTRGFVDLGFDVLGVDFSPTAIAQARVHVPKASFKVSPLPLLRLSERFDVVVAVDVLLHIVDGADWAAALSALIDHLDPSGLLIVLDTFADSSDAPEHCHPRPFETYQALFEARGLRVVEHVRLPLEAEGSMKDLVAVTKPLER